MLLRSPSSIIAATIAAYVCVPSSLADRVPLFTSNPVLGGYDVVAYHYTEDASFEGLMGSSSIAYNFTGFQFWFASEQNRDLFIENPWRFAPAYGGHCAWGICCERAPRWPWKRDFLGPPAGPNNGWSIYKGRLYFNIWDAIRDQFFHNQEKYIADADTRWKDWWGGIYAGPFNTHCFGGRDGPKKDWCNHESHYDASGFLDSIDRSLLDPGYFKEPDFNVLPANGTGSLEATSDSGASDDLAKAHEKEVVIVFLSLSAVAIIIILILLLREFYQKPPESDSPRVSTSGSHVALETRDVDEEEEGEDADVGDRNDLRSEDRELKEIGTSSS